MTSPRTVANGMQSGIPVDKGRAVCSAVSDDPAGGTSGIGMELAGSQAKAAVRAAPRTLPGAPSWGRVLATTVSLWTGRRVARLRHPRLALFLTICLAVAAAAVVSVVQFTGTSPRTASPARPHAGAARLGAGGRRGRTGAGRGLGGRPGEQRRDGRLRSARCVPRCARTASPRAACCRSGYGRVGRCGGRGARRVRCRPATAGRAGAAGQFRVRGQRGRGPDRSPGRVRRLPAGSPGRPGRAPVRGHAAAAQPAHRCRRPGPPGSSRRARWIPAC